MIGCPHHQHTAFRLRSRSYAMPRMTFHRDDLLAIPRPLSPPRVPSWVVMERSPRGTMAEVLPGGGFFQTMQKSHHLGQLSYAGMSMISSSELSHYHYLTKKVLNHVDLRNSSSNSSIPSRNRCFARSSEYPISSATHPQRVSLRFLPK